MSDPFVEIMGPLGVLRKQIEVAFAKCGLKAVHVGILPGSHPEGPHEVQVLAVLGEIEPPAGLDEFQQVITQARDAEMDERAKVALDELQSGLQGSKGFLDGPLGDT